MWEASEKDLFADTGASAVAGAGQPRRPAPSRDVSGELAAEDLDQDRTLRPQTLDQYCGQERVRANLRVLIEAAKSRNEPLDHVIFSGPPGLGKTTLAGIVANEMGAKLHTTSGPAIERAGDLAAILTNLEEGDVLFVDEIHRLNHQIGALNRLGRRIKRAVDKADLTGDGTAFGRFGIAHDLSHQTLRLHGMCHGGGDQPQPDQGHALVDHRHFTPLN